MFGSLRLAIDPDTLKTGCSDWTSGMYDYREGSDDPGPGEWPEEEIALTLVVECGPLDAPDWLATGSTVGRDYSWHQVFTPAVRRES